MIRLADIARAAEGSEKTIFIDGLHGAAKGLAMSACAHSVTAAPIIIITATEERALELLDDIRCFLHPEEGSRLRHMPESTALPYSRISPDPELWADRLNVLHELADGRPLIVVASVASLMRRLPPRSFIRKLTRTIRRAEAVDPHELCRFLADAGYEDVGLVEDEGSFARRGGIVDLWSPTMAAPVRLEFEGERILSMRSFDPATQRSKEEVLDARLIPVRDFPFDEQARAKAAHRIRERSEEGGLSAHERRALIEAIHEGIAISGIETLMPLFHDGTETIFDYLTENATVIVDESADAEAAANALADEAADLAATTLSPERIAGVDEILLTPGELWKRIDALRSLHFDALETGAAEEVRTRIACRTESNADLRLLVEGHARSEDMLAPLVRRIEGWRREGMRVLFTCHTEMQAARLKDLFRMHGMELAAFDTPFPTIFEMSATSVRLMIGRLSSGFRWIDEQLIVITDAEVFGQRQIRKKQAAARPMEPFTSFAEIAEGDFIVHEQHGIGRYKGLSHLTIDGTPGDYLLLEYLGGDKLYLPVYRLGLVGRYIGTADAPPTLDRLGGARWAAAQSKVSRAIMLLAKELIDIYAAREVFPGVPLPQGGTEYEEFCAAFPYDETPDQARAIDDVMVDMGRERPMDRLVCGDVGYGKTEVAMRAAFRAALAGFQVAVLVPTTVLAFQHYETFSKRFAGLPMRIEMLSRFRSAKEQKKVVEDVKAGLVDIVVGTHRIVQKDVAFKKLGLLVIDEEHRFGVRHKERIKTLRATVDVMAMTATPIPRTLNLSLTGIRDISVINTPPADRQSIATYVVPMDEGIVRQAILRELARGGQVFFVHNRVETIASMQARLKRIVPEARIVVGHGQLPENALEKVMLDFVERRADILLCTTIIESGLDIPSANTIIVHRADTFGLAQLYQLRGRVGRSNVKAFAYLMTPEDGRLTAIAKKRLTVLKRFTELGSGFQIAMHDLEFRGAGNILGRAQSGHVAAVGYELYAKLLDRAVRKLMGRKVEEELDPELNLRVPAFLPEEYIADPGTRIDVYKRLAGRETPDEIEAIGEELADRFGHLPIEAQNLIAMMEVRLLARRLGMKQVLFDGRQLSCQLTAGSKLSTEFLLKLAQTERSRYRIVPPDRLVIAVGEATGQGAIAAAKNSLSALAAYVTETSLY